MLHQEAILLLPLKNNNLKAAVIFLSQAPSCYKLKQRENIKKIMNKIRDT